jgi:formylglycine-generating enzyme required for sulfatase activity
MEEETSFEPSIAFQYPANNQQIFRGTEVKVTAQLLGFTNYKSIDSVYLMIDDSIVLRTGKKESIEYLWETIRYSAANHTLSIEVSYKDKTPEYTEWNYFNVRDYIEEEEEDTTTEQLNLTSSISVSLQEIQRGNPSLSFITVPADTFSYKGKTIVLDSFRISTHEVTAKQYTDFLNAIQVKADGTYGNMTYIYLGNSGSIKHDGSKFVVIQGKDSLPVTNVSWLGANNYCRWAGGRLPSITEFYYATAPDQLGDPGYTLNDLAWFKSNSGDKLHKIGTKGTNPYGLYDILGNAAEWCLDNYSAEIYPIAEDTLFNPILMHQNQLKTYKGGSWSSQAFETNPDVRKPLHPLNASNLVGFRVCRPVN